jgi:hypothetical protein
VNQSSAWFHWPIVRDRYTIRGSSWFECRSAGVKRRAAESGLDDLAGVEAEDLVVQAASRV